MLEIRIHGRGGQGAVTAASLLAMAAGHDDKYSQGFPAFGVERRGAPIKAFARISEEPITIRSQVYNPDYVMIMDPTLCDLPEITEGIKPETTIIINGKPDCRMIAIKLVRGPDSLLEVKTSITSILKLKMILNSS